MFGLYWLITGLVCVAALLWALVAAKDSEMYKESKILLNGNDKDVDADFDKLGVLIAMGIIHNRLTENGQKADKESVAKAFLKDYDETKEVYGRHSGKSGELQLFYGLVLILVMVFGFIIVPFALACRVTSKLKK